MTAEAGVLLVDKPGGVTSHDVVARLRRDRGLKGGHAGTLDPFATGLLLLCVGPATRLAEYFHLLPKRYDGELRLGVETATHDRDGEPVRASERWREVTEVELREALALHTGELEQRPPAFSAKRVGGRRAHEAARAGERPELEPVPVKVHRLELRAFEPPTARITAVVSTGTYVRALARDLGRHLGCLAHLGALRRTAVGPFRVEDALPAERLDEGGAGPVLGGTDPWWLGPAESLRWLPRRELDDAEAVRIRTGARIPEGRVEKAAPSGGSGGVPGGDAAPEAALPVALVHEGRLLAIATPGDDGGLQPRKVFAHV